MFAPMDLRPFAAAFGTVFVAELGDKTQLAALALATGARSKLAVFAGASLALVATTALAVAGADLLARAVPARWLERAGGGLFLALGLWTLLRPAPPDDHPPPAGGAREVHAPSDRPAP